MKNLNNIMMKKMLNINEDSRAIDHDILDLAYIIKSGI